MDSEEKDYYSDFNHVSASMLKVLLKSPETYYRRFVAKDLPQEETPAMKFGSMFHCAVLEPMLFEDSYVVMPDFHLHAANVTAKGERSDSKATSYCKAKTAEWTAENKGRTFVTQDEINLCSRLFRSLHSHSDISYLLHAEGEIEKPIRWEDRIHRKCKPDKVCHREGVILDLKTTDETFPAAFASKAAKLAYYLQAAWYRQAIMATVGDSYRFMFAVVSKAEPHECALYELSETDLEWADSECERLVTELVDRHESNNWKAGWQSGVVKLALPKWVRSEFYSMEVEVYE